MNEFLQKLFNVKIGKPYRFVDDYGGKYCDGSIQKPLQYIPTKIKLGRVFYDIVSTKNGFIGGSSIGFLTFVLYYRPHD